MTKLRVLIAVSLLFPGCQGAVGHDETSAAEPDTLALTTRDQDGRKGTPLPRPFEAQLLGAASEYLQWTRVSDQANFAPTMCWAPPPTGVQRSRSASLETHGRKLYFLFAKDAASYRELDFFEGRSASEQADLERSLIGQVIVKQSWKPVEVPIDQVPEPPTARTSGERGPWQNYRVEDGHAWRIGEQSDLFVMLKLDPATPGTDRGWVYGTLTPDGSRVTAAGRLESCMDCHVDAPRDRLFGLFPPR